MPHPPSPIPKAVVIDLDGTILHAEPAEIGVWGRTAYRYLSQEAADRLAAIGQVMPVVLATGRSARSVAGLVRQLPEVNFGGFVLENGEYTTTDLDLPVPTEARWDELFEKLPGWNRLDGFIRCLGVIPPPGVAGADALLEELIAEPGFHLWRDGKKRFIYATEPGKGRGTRDLGFEPFVALGNELNDLDLLLNAVHLGTPGDAHPEIRSLIAARGGFVASSSHAGSVELLDWALRCVR